jgi:hypothetical protein
MIELSPEDLKFRESAEFPGAQTRTNILSAASALENRKLEAYQDSRLVNLGTTDFLMAISCGSLYPTKPVGQYREDLANYLSPYVFKRIVEFERDGKSDLTIADWMRRIARKIELNPGDIKFKNSEEFPQYTEQIKWAAKALENTNRPQALYPGDVWGQKRSAVGVLLDFMIVNGKRYDGGIAALSEKPGEALRLAEKIGLISEVDQHHQYIARQQLSKHISEYIVGRIRYLNDFERCNFKEIAQWLRLFVEH